jgi:CheY-like chemotaxis protein/anti-sigma regulatory factor (Ser/Thr protein kinase)
VRSAVDGVTPTSEAKSIRIDVAVDPELGPVTGDAERLRLVVWHLLSNAVKFTPAGGRIVVSVTHGGSAAEISVTDTGSGIAPATLPQLFAAPPLAATVPDRRGLGLGLSLVRQIVELHGGTVSAVSDGPGRGSTFRVRLPFAAADATGPLDLSPAPRLEGVRVVVEDERASERGRIASALLEAGASVVTAASSQEALALMRDDSRDVLVVSLSAGQKNGYWLAREALVVALNRGERLAVVALGSADQSEERTLVAGVAIDRYLPAPVDPTQLVSAVAEVSRNSPHHAH